MKLRPERRWRNPPITTPLNIDKRRKRQFDLEITMDGERHPGGEHARYALVSVVELVSSEGFEPCGPVD